MDNFPGYSIDINGRVYSTKGRGIRILRANVVKSGYCLVHLRGNGSTKALYVHRIMGEIFLNLSPGLQINHINGIKTDNRLTNLELCTPSENISHSFNTGLHKGYGRNHHNTILIDSDIIRIRALLSSGELSMAEIGRKFGVGPTAIHGIKYKITWRHIL